ncbi:hypothetical protein VOI32_36115 [Paraburkholderia caribensis]|uniref:Uncharacterized protein n=1 Tax=Paraburkholderia caribensis TaxID=75105 RepID=A0ABV0E7H1_9BURK|nr:hypothetical protein [Paraburkholderia caribensis]MCO4879787.1 hypothetical protein [Paraburkholderia caribensis]
MEATDNATPRHVGRRKRCTARMSGGFAWAQARTEISRRNDSIDCLTLTHHRQKRLHPTKTARMSRRFATIGGASGRRDATPETTSAESAPLARADSAEPFKHQRDQA